MEILREQLLSTLMDSSRRPFYNSMTIMVLHQQRSSCTEMQSQKDNLRLVYPLSTHSWRVLLVRWRYRVPWLRIHQSSSCWSIRRLNRGSLSRIIIDIWILKEDWSSTLKSQDQIGLSSTSSHMQDQLDSKVQQDMRWLQLNSKMVMRLIQRISMILHSLFALDSITITPQSRYLLLSCMHMLWLTTSPKSIPRKRM